MQITIYGIHNCDKIRAARKWLDANAGDYSFHDFRKDGISPAVVAGLLQQTTAEALVNRRSSSWKALSAAERADVDAGDSALIAVLCAYPTLIKRPVLQLEKQLLIGFDVEAYRAACV